MMKKLVFIASCLYVLLLNCYKDSTPPEIIEGPEVTQITTNSVTIKWRTDEVSTSIVEYGTTSVYNNKKEDLSYVSEHIITLTDLKPLTVYHYRVGSVDKRGNGPTYSDDRIFQTLSTGLAIRIFPPDIEVDTNDSFEVSVNVDNVNDLFGASIEIIYDHEIINALSVVPGEVLGNDILFISDIRTDTVSYSATRKQGSGGVTGSGVLCKITFKAIKSGESGIIFLRDKIQLINEQGEPIEGFEDIAILNGIVKVK